MLSVVLDLGKIYIKRDQPKAALDLYGSYLEKFPGSTALMIATARVYEAMFQLEQASGFYKQVLSL